MSRRRQFRGLFSVSSRIVRSKTNDALSSSIPTGVSHLYRSPAIARARSNTIRDRNRRRLFTASCIYGAVGGRRRHFATRLRRQRRRRLSPANFIGAPAASGNHGDGTTVITNWVPESRRTRVRRRFRTRIYPYRPAVPGRGRHVRRAARPTTHPGAGDLFGFGSRSNFAPFRCRTRASMWVARLRVLRKRMANGSAVTP